MPLSDRESRNLSNVFLCPRPTYTDAVGCVVSAGGMLKITREEGKTYSQMVEMGGQESLLSHPIPAAVCSVKGTSQVGDGRWHFHCSWLDMLSFQKVGWGRQGSHSKGEP